MPGQVYQSRNPFPDRDGGPAVQRRRPAPSTNSTRAGAHGPRQGFLRPGSSHRGWLQSKALVLAVASNLSEWFSRRELIEACSAHALSVGQVVGVLDRALRSRTIEATAEREPLSWRGYGRLYRITRSRGAAFINYLREQEEKKTHDAP